MPGGSEAGQDNAQDNAQDKAQDNAQSRTQERAYDAVVFDLLTALIDSWSLWNSVAGSAERGLSWRRKYLELTYQAGAYRPYEAVVRQAAGLSGSDPGCAGEL